MVFPLSFPSLLYPFHTLYPTLLIIVPKLSTYLCPHSFIPSMIFLKNHLHANMPNFISSPQNSPEFHTHLIELTYGLRLLKFNILKKKKRTLVLPSLKQSLPFLLFQQYSVRQLLSSENSIKARHGGVADACVPSTQEAETGDQN